MERFTRRGEPWGENTEQPRAFGQEESKVGVDLVARRLPNTLDWALPQCVKVMEAEVMASLGYMLVTNAPQTDFPKTPDLERRARKSHHFWYPPPRAPPAPQLHLHTHTHTHTNHLFSLLIHSISNTFLNPCDGFFDVGLAKLKYPVIPSDANLDVL